MKPKVRVGFNISYDDAVAKYREGVGDDYKFDQNNVRYCWLTGMAEADRITRRHHTWLSMDVANDCDDECQHLIATRDPLSTGDSPTEYECACKHMDECPVAMRVDDEW